MTDRGEPTPELEYYLELACTLPKIPIEDPSVQAILAARERGDEETERAITSEMSLWMNNFYAVFLEMRMKREQSESAEPKQYMWFYIPRAVKMGSAWEQFTSDNTELISRIDEELGKFKPVSELMSYPMHLATARSGLTPQQASERFEELNSATEHPLGISAIYYAATDRINPLLKQAWTQMEAVGINPEIFAWGGAQS